MHCIYGKGYMMPPIVLEHAALLDGTVNERRDGYHVVIEADRIREVSDIPITLQHAQRIDLGGRTLMPGLIDAHVHVIATSLNVMNLANEPTSLTTARALRIAEGMLQRGFTTVRDAGGADWGLAAALDSDLSPGPRVFFSGRALSQTGGHGDFRSRTWETDSCACCMNASQLTVIADGVPAVQHAAREELRRGATQIKIMGSGGVASPTDPVWNLQYSEDEIRAIVWEAHAWRTYVMAHAYTPEAIARCVRFGVRSIEHGNLLDANTAAIMADHQAFLVPTLVTYEAMHREGKQGGLPQVSIDKIKDVREAGLQAVEHAQAAGVAIGFGTDLLGETHHYESLEFALRAQVHSPFEVIRSATLVNADLLNRTGELGVIAPGALADLLVVDGNPLDDLNLLQEQGKHLSLIMKGGKLYKQMLG
jgi:imidazolonepropionase-like amidohydrolase